MKTRGNILAVAVAVIALTVGTSGSSLAFWNYYYYDHLAKKQVGEDQQKHVSVESAEATAPKKSGGPVKEESDPQSSVEKAAEARPAPEGPKGE